MTTNTTPNLPANATLTARKDGAFALRCPWEDGLPAALKRLGGEWDAAARVWIIPADQLDKLDALFARRSAKANKPEAVAAREAEALQRDRSNAAKWIGYVEAAAAEGRIYDNGVSKLRGELNVARWPELQTRLDAAIALARETRHQMEARWAQEKAERNAAAASAHAERAAHRDLVLAHRAPALNTPLRRHGKAVVYTGTGKAWRLDEENEADVFAGHLLGHDGEFVCYAYFREATAEEIAMLELREATEKALSEVRAMAQAQLVEAEQTIVALGDRPQQPEVAGVEHHNTRNIYGGGRRFVVGSEWVWFVKGNGADGDDWSYNNLPGEIAWRAPYSAALAALIESRHDL